MSILKYFSAGNEYNCVINNAWKLRRPCKKLRIRIISGHHLPKTDRKIKGNVIQPYVTIKIRGHVIDENEFSTEVIPKVLFQPLVHYTVGQNMNFSGNLFSSKKILAKIIKIRTFRKIPESSGKFRKIYFLAPMCNTKKCLF